MFDDSKTISFDDNASNQRFHWSAMPLETLLRYKLEIEAHLPPTKLRDVDVEAELVTQLRLAQAFQARVIDDMEIPANQVVTAINSVSAVIEKLSKLQIELAAAENLKRMEAAFIKAVEGLPDEAIEKFFLSYDRIARVEGVEQE